MVHSGLKASIPTEQVSDRIVEGQSAEQIAVTHKAVEKPGISMLARESLGLPPEWTPCSWAVQGEDPEPWGMKVEGGIYQPLLSGKRKGQPNYRKGSMLRTFVASMAQIEAHEAAWEARTGLCRHCVGTGWKWAGWNHERGNRYRPCKCGRPQMDVSAYPSTCGTERSAVNQARSALTGSAQG